MINEKNQPVINEFSENELLTRYRNGDEEAFREIVNRYRQAAAGFLATIIFCQIGNVMACRTNRQSATRHVFKYNSWITAGVVVELLFIFGIIYLPVAVIHQFFTTAPLPLGIWLVIVLTPFVIFGIEEIRKFLVRRGFNILSA